MVAFSFDTDFEYQTISFYLTLRNDNLKILKENKINKWDNNFTSAPSRVTSSLFPHMSTVKHL